MAGIDEKEPALAIIPSAIPAQGHQAIKWLKTFKDVRFPLSAGAWYFLSVLLI